MYGQNSTLSWIRAGAPYIPPAPSPPRSDSDLLTIFHFLDSGIMPANINFEWLMPVADFVLNLSRVNLWRLIGP